MREIYHADLMVIHDVDESILLSDRISLISPGPEAKIMDEVNVPIPRPRTRTDIIEHPAYYPIRNCIIRFLSAKSHRSEDVKVNPVA
jgi:nitrate/nitrite transport system ATP-binding protein